MSDSVRIRNDALAEHSAEIRKLGKRAVQNIIEIGRRLTEAKKIVGWGNWLPWLEREFGWSERTAQNFMQVAELAESATVADLLVDFRGLYLLASPAIRNRHPEIIEAVAERSARGETTTSDEIKEAARHVRTTGAAIATLPGTAAEFHAEIAKRHSTGAEASTLTPRPNLYELSVELAAEEIIGGFKRVSHQVDRRAPQVDDVVDAVVKTLLGDNESLPAESAEGSGLRVSAKARA